MPSFTIASSSSKHAPPSSHQADFWNPPDTTGNQFSTSLEGGGNATSAALPNSIVSESYELADYAGIRKRQKGDAQRIQQEAKRAEKRRKFDEQDEMKFSHSIQFNAVPDWSSHYIAYSNLKKL